MKTSNYRPDIDGLRAVAVLSVVGFHAFPGLMRGGFVGVDIFFVISGYLITTILLVSLQSGTFSLVDFYDRRVRRIFPALLTVIATTLSVGWFVLLPDEFAELGKHVAAGAAFVSNLVLYSETGYFDNAADGKLMLHLWSLAVEEQFYILWPLLLALVWRRRRGLVIVLAVVAAVSFTANLLLVQRDPSAAFYWPISRFWELMAGGTLAYVMLNFPRLAKGNANLMSWAGAALLVAGFVTITKARAFPGWWALLPVLGATLMIAAGPSAWFNKHVLSNRIAVWFGLISYPLYLWHWPLFSMAHVLEGGGTSRNLRLGLVLVSIVLAWLTFVLVERPIRLRQKTWSPTLAATMAALLVAGLVTFTQSGFAERKIAGVKRAPPANYKIPEQTTSGDGSCRLQDAMLARYCIAQVNPASPVQVVVLGDSQALGWTKAAIRAGQEDGYGVAIVSNMGCPPIIGVRQTPSLAEKSSCDKLGQTDQILDAVLQLKPVAVILVGRWDLYFQGYTRNGKIEKTSHFLTTSADAAASPATTRDALASQLPATLEKIKAAGGAAVVAMNPPVLQGNIRNFRRDVQVTREQHQQYQTFIHHVLMANGVPIFDPAERLCASGTCAIYDDDGLPLYADDNHLSNAGSLFLYPAIRDVLRRAATGDFSVRSVRS